MENNSNRLREFETVDRERRKRKLRRGQKRPRQNATLTTGTKEKKCILF